MTSILLLCALLLPGPGGTPEGASSRRLESLVAAERAFASLALRAGVDSAFLANLADDAVLLRPGPVRGKEWIREHPGPPIELRWEPGLAIVSLAGDMGFTSGPFTVRSLSGPPEPPASGDFVTAWKRQAGGVWKVMFDQGVNRRDSTVPGVRQVKRLLPFPPKRRDTTGARAALCALDTSGLDAGMPAGRLLDPEVRLFRPGMPVIAGLKDARAYFRKPRGPYQRRALFADVAASNDLAYTYGAYQRSAPGGEGHGYYFTIWRRAPSGPWRALIDVEGRLLR